MIINADTKFKHGDKVIITSGYYRGRKGKIKSYWVRDEMYVVRFFWSINWVACKEYQLEFLSNLEQTEREAAE